MKVLRPPAVTSKKYPGLVEYLDRALGTGTGAGAERHYDCPFCLDRVGSESSKQKLDINIVKGVARCYRCSFKAGSLETLLRAITKNRLTLAEHLLIRGTVTREEGSLVASVKKVMKAAAQKTQVMDLKPTPLPAEFNIVSELTGDSAEIAQGYLLQRGAPSELWDKYSIGYCATGLYRQRLIFPVWMGGEVVYFTSRYCGEHLIKALSPKVREGYVSRSDVLYNYDSCVGAPIVAIAEGAFSAMAFEWADIPAVATFGKAFSANQLAWFRELAAHGLQEVVMAFDADAANATTDMHAALLDLVPNVTYLPMTDGDPWDVREDLSALMAKRTSLSFSAKVLGRLQGRK